ncbi:MAG: type I-B CRISPR-associated protein Cas8b1/Cst1 [Methanotrichaceae archaeon]
MLQYTGHPLVDVGAATILAFCGKHSLSSLTESDLDKIADFISKEYVINPLQSFLTVAFPNSGFTQPAFKNQPERRGDYANRVTRSFHKSQPVIEEICPFTGDRAPAIAFSDKENFPMGRVFRQHVPLLLGEDQINFFANGSSGLPISGKALLCIQAMPLGCAKCGGKLLAVHSDNPELTELFAKKFLKNNLNAITLAHQQGGSKLPESGPAKTVLIDTLLLADLERFQSQQDHQSASLTAYHFSNSGQSNALDTRNPPLEIYHLPLEIMDFLWAVHNPEYKVEWQAVTQRSWQLSKIKKGKKEDAVAKEDARPRRNYLYEDIFRLPQDALRFMRCYFLRIPVRNTSQDDPRRGYSLKSDADIISWKLTELFLRKVMHLKESRIQRIREIGDQLADYVNEENDRRFFSTFYGEQTRYDVIRNSLIRVNHARLKKGKPPIIRLDPFVEVFEEPDERGWSTWKLARDLVLIRMIERLYDLKWIQNHTEVLQESVEETSENKPIEA